MNVLYISENQLVEEVSEYDVKPREEETPLVAVAFPWTPENFSLGSRLTCSSGQFKNPAA